jgi:HK97 family phage portal protein
MDAPRPNLVQRVLALIHKATAPASLSSPPGWWWPPGNGDRGPPGSWQMNRGQYNRGYELTAFSAVYACVNIIAADISKLPIQVWEIDLDSGTRELKRRDYYAALMREPNGYQTAADFIQTFVQSYLLQGNAFAYAGDRNARGEIKSLHVLNPHRVKTLINQENGEIYYECAEDFLAGLKPNTVVPERDMIHHRLPLLPGYPLMGVTPIFAASASSALGLRILQDSQQFFGNSSRPSGVLSVPGHISDELQTRMKQDWDEAYRGAEFGKVAVLKGGTTWQPLTITATDAQLIEQLRYSVEDVGRVFRLPPFMLGDMSKVSYRNTEQMTRAYLSNCIGWHLEALEQRFSRAFDFPAKFEIRFDLTALLRTEIDIRFAAYQQALNAGWTSINEVRASEGLEPVDGGDEPRVQMQYVPLSQALTPPAGGPGPAPAPAPAPEPAEPIQDAIDVERVRLMVRDRLRRAA